MGNLTKDFVSEEKREYRFRFGDVLASSLTGFICGFFVASMVWLVIIKYLQVIN
jgi:tetrahydromethanopterin S-methyltransferase subunit F